MVPGQSTRMANWLKHRAGIDFLPMAWRYFAFVVLQFAPEQGRLPSTFFCRLVMIEQT
jgi:hypothetical protein